MIHRLPTTEILRPYVGSILSLMLKLLQTDNEENILVCLRIIIELHKQYRPQFNTEIHMFLTLVKQIYSDLPKHMPKIFEPRQPSTLRVKDLKDLNMEQLLSETYTITPIQVVGEKKPGESGVANYNLIPKGILSLKVLQELPIIVVLMCVFNYHCPYKHCPGRLHVNHSFNLQVSNIQAICAPRGLRICTIDHDNDFIATITDATQSIIIQQGSVRGFYGRSNQNTFISRLHHSIVSRRNRFACASHGQRNDRLTSIMPQRSGPFTQRTTHRCTTHLGEISCSFHYSLKQKIVPKS